MVISCKGFSNYFFSSLDKNYLYAKLSTMKKQINRFELLKQFKRFKQLVLSILISSILFSAGCGGGKFLTSTGAEEQFGTNKVRDRFFSWKVVESEHFQVHFYKDGEELAKDLSAVLEKDYSRISDMLAIQQEGKAPFFLYLTPDDYYQTNVTLGEVEGSGGFTEFFKNRVAFYPRGSQKWLRLVATHEYAHHLSDQYIMGGSLPYRSFTIFINAIINPHWYSEGLAEYISGDFDSYADMLVRDAAIDDKLIPFRQLNGFYHLKPRQVLLAYKEGYTIFEFLVNKYGKQVPAIMTRDIKNQLNPYKSIERATNGQVDQSIRGEWENYLKEKYNKQIAGKKEPWDASAQLTKGPGWKIYPVVSPDSKRIAYLSDEANEQGDYDLYIMDADGKNKKRLTRNVLIRSLGISFSPDGKYIAFVSNKKRRDDIYIIPSDGGFCRRVKISLRHNSHPSFSPDSKRIIFTSLIKGYTDIYIADIDGKNLTQITNTKEYEESPIFSPDSSRIYFAREMNEQKELFVMNADGTNIERLTENNFDDFAPTISSDGKRLYYVSDRNGIFNIYSMNIAGGSITQHTDVTGGNLYMSVRQAYDENVTKEREIVFSSYRNGIFNIYKMQ